MEFQYNDGGRRDAGFRGTAGDCSVRAIAIATGKPYKEVYDALYLLIRSSRQTKRIRGKSPRTGTPTVLLHRYMTSIGWKWTPCMKIGSGCQTHLSKHELPSGRIVCRVSRHLCAVIDGVIHDTGNPSRSETRCVYGYWAAQ